MPSSSHKETASQSSLLASILRRLMDEAHVIEADLARQTGLPQTTINRLLQNETQDPRANTLIPIAKFFGITIGQLLGQEPSPPHRIPSSIHPTNKSAWSIIPIIHWHEVKTWIAQKSQIAIHTYHHWVSTEKNVGEASFALKTLPFMEPRFRKHSIIIVDPNFSYQDGHFVITCCDNAEPTVRRVLKDGIDIYFTKLYGKKEPIPKQSSDHIIGTIIETRINEN